MPAGQLVFDTIIALVKWKIRKLNTKKQTKNTSTRNVWVGWREESEARWSKRERQRQTETEADRDRDGQRQRYCRCYRTASNQDIYK